MEEKNKYSDLILEIIREHRKYSQVKDFEDRVVENVYLRAKPILSSIDDQSTLESYLKKVVSVSIVTMSKSNRQTIKPEKDFTVSSDIIKEESADNIQTLLFDADEEKENVNDKTDYFSAMQNNDESEFLSEDTETNIQENDFVNETESLIEEEQDINSQEEVLSFDLAPEDVTTEVESSDSDVLTDLPIDDVQDACFVDDSSSEIIIEDDEAADIYEHETVEEVSFEDDSESDTVENEVSVSDEYIHENDESKPLVANEDEPLISNGDDDSLTTELSDKMINSIDESDYEGVLDIQNITKNDVTEEDNVLIQDTILDSLDTDRDAPILLEQDFVDTSEQDFIKEESIEILDENIQQSENLLESVEFNDELVLGEADEMPVDNQIIEQALDIDENEIKNKLCALSEEYSSLPILSIFNLKYKENLSVDEITKILSLTEDKVTESLCKIISIVEE